MFFTTIGVAVASVKLTEFIVWLDTPKGGHSHEKA